MPSSSESVAVPREETTMKKVMIVDDSRTVRQQVVAALGPAGFQVVEAQDGIEALERMRSTPDLALIICDVNMPRMNGLEMLGAARESGILSIPVVMLTTEGRTDLIEKAKRAGARGWLVKPFKPDQLIAVARKLTGLI
jgi:two-component system chemotaxis response regulator CheY